MKINFKVMRPASLDIAMHERVRYQFKKLRLRQHFLRESNSELFDRRDALREIFELWRDASAVREYLAREARSVRAARGLNNWKTALLLALQRSDSFCGGGFLRLYE